MPNDESQRVFDVSRPGSAAPPATSRPMIGGMPASSDPMLNENTASAIPVNTGEEASVIPGAEPTRIPVTEDASMSPDLQFTNQTDVNVNNVTNDQTGPMPGQPQSMASPEVQNRINSHPLFQADDGIPPNGQPPAANVHYHQPKRRHWLAWLLVLILAVLIGGYLAIDSGLVKSSINLPFHIFKQKGETAQTSTPASSSTAPQQTQSAASAAALQTYSDDFLTLKYPTAWTVVRNDNTSLPGTKSLKIYGPNDSDIAASTAVTKGHKASLTLNIFKDTKAGALCNCKIYDTSTLTMPQFKDGKLVITSDTRQGGDPTTPATDLVVTTDKNAVTGTAKINTDLAVNGAYFSVWATINDNDVPDITISDLAAFENSQSVQDLAGILNSIQFK